MKTTLPLFALMSLLAAAFANAGVASSPGEPSSASLPPAAARPEGSPHHSRVLFDAPGHAAPEGAAVTARGGAPGAPWRLVDWRGREVEGAAGAFDEHGEATLPPLPAGYYRLVGGGASRPGEPSLATLAVVSPLVPRPSSLVTGEPATVGSPFAVDTAIAWISRPGAFLCPWNDGDTQRTVADLVRLCGFRHVRDRLRWGAAQPSPDAPPDFSRNLATAALFRERGASVSGMFHDAPPWTHPAPKLPGDLGALHRFCAETAAAFDDSTGDWEFWNEPDIHFAPEPVWEYAAAMKAAYLGFKAARPDLPVLNGALCQTPGRTRYFEPFFDNDVAPYFDIFNYHTYLPPAKYPEAFGKLRDLLREHGAEDKPVWVTEFGTNLEGHSDLDGAKAGQKAHSPEQELVHAEFYPKAQIALQMQGVERAYFFVFAAFNERNGRKDWGVLRRDGTVKPVFSAMATAIRELDGTRLLGALDAPAGIRAFLFERPDGAQTVAFWSESPIDTMTSHAPAVAPEPDFARKWRLKTDGGFPPPPPRLVDLCGMGSEVAPEADGSLALPATRFPAYLSGLRGLVAAKGPAAAAASFAGAAEEAATAAAAASFAGATEEAAAAAPDASFAGAAPSAPSPIVLRPVLDRADFSLSGGKTLAVMKGDAGHARIEVWNFSDSARTGIVEVAGASLSGLPDAPFAIDPGACAAFECVLAPETADSNARLALCGNFDGCSPARSVVPVFFEKRFLASCEREPLETADPALWEKNGSADEMTIAFDETEGAIRFDAVWSDDRADRWFYPIRRLRLPDESPVGALRIAFEVKSDQDKVENDYRTCKLMLADDAGKTDLYLDYDPPTREWEMRHVDIPKDTDLSDVTLLRIGANPLGTRLTLHLRNLAILRAP